MTKTQITRLCCELCMRGALVGCLICFGLAPALFAQAAAEAAATTSISSSIGAKAKFPEIPSIPLPGGSNVSSNPAPATNASPAASTHIVASMRGQSVESNRQALEFKAGKDGARLLIRSTPSQAQIWIDDKPVGTTPLLLIIPPGKYTIELRGTRQETAKQELALLPREVRELAVKLEQRYPSRVVFR